MNHYRCDMCGCRAAQEGVKLEGAWCVEGCPGRMMSVESDGVGQVVDAMAAAVADAEALATGELPVYIQGRRNTRALRRQLKNWPHPVFYGSCEDCGLSVVISGSSHQIRERSEVWIPVVCDECAELRSPAAIVEPTEEQRRELDLAAKKIEADLRRN